QRPGLGYLLQQEPRWTAPAVAAREGQALAVGRPARHLVNAGGGGKVGDRLVVAGIDADEGVVFPVRNESQALAVRGPLQVAILAAVEEQPLRIVLVGGGQWHAPDLVVLDVGKPAGCGQRRLVA